jgi:hypothetical protein
MVSLLAARLGLAGGLAASALVASQTVSYAADEKDKAEKKSKNDSSSLFDPEALERGAKALREINKSPFAKQVSVTRNYNSAAARSILCLTP